MGKIIDNYSLQEVLGEGVYGKVFKGIHIKTKAEVAVKVIKADKFREIPKLEECTVNEINTLSSMQENIHIVKYLDMLKTVNNFYFVYEYCNGGTLEKLMRSYRETPEKVMPLTKTLVYFRDILDAFKTLTRNNIMHRDLKPDNILLHNGVIKLADFGFCKSLKSPTDLAQTMLGSPIYMAPEVIKGEIYTMKADIWSLGVVFFQMVFGQCPFQSNSIAKLIQILQTEELRIPFPVPEAVEMLIRRMLVKDPAKRIDWADLFEYKITESGQIIEPRHLSINPTNPPQVRSIRNLAPTQLFNPSQSMGSASNAITPMSIRAQQPQNTISIKQDSSFNDSSSFRVTTSNPNYMQVDYRNNPPIKQIEPRRQVPSNSVHVNQPDTTSKQSYQSVSPIRERKSIYSELIKKHKKLTSVAKLSVEIIKENIREAVGLSYLITQTIEKELLLINDSLNKEQPYNQDDEVLSLEFSIQIENEINSVKEILKAYKDQIERSEDINTLPAKKNRYIKRFIDLFRPAIDSDPDKAILAMQLLDYFEDSILLKKEAYRTLTKDNLVRQINHKLAKLT